MTPLRCAIIDDEPLARKGLREYIEDTAFLQLAGEFDSPLKVTEALRDDDIHLLFLDIQMPRLTGLDWMRTVPDLPPVIFTTAYPNYALEGFELNALDYLVKPISFDRFLKAALRAREYYEVRSLNAAGGQPTSRFFFIKADNKLVRLQFDDILFVEALQNYVAIHTKTKKYITYLTFKSLEEFLPAGQFVKTHKSYLVPIDKIDNIDGNEIHIGSYRVPISRSTKDEVLERLLSGRFPKR